MYQRSGKQSTKIAENGFSVTTNHAIQTFSSDFNLTTVARLKRPVKVFQKIACKTRGQNIF